MKFSEQILQYLQGDEMDPATIAEIEHRLTQDQSFADDVAKQLETLELSRDLKRGIHHYGMEKLRARIKEVSDELEQAGFFLTEKDLKDYESGTISEKKKQQIDKLINEESAPNEDLLKGIQLQGKEQLKDKLKGVENSLKQEGFFDSKSSAPPIQKAKYFNLFRMTAVAATVALIVSVWFLMNRTNQTYEQLFATSFEPVEDRISGEIDEMLSGFGFVVGPEEEKKYKALKQCIDLYNKKDYDEAITSFKQYIADYPDDHDAKLYSAVSLLEKDRPDEVILLLSPIKNLKDFEMAGDVDWYLALAYLKTGEIGKAKQLLTAIEDLDYQEKANELLEKL